MSEPSEFADPYEVRISFDWSDPAVHVWFYELISKARCPQYRESILVQSAQKENRREA